MAQALKDLSQVIHLSEEEEGFGKEFVLVSLAGESVGFKVFGTVGKHVVCWASLEVKEVVGQEVEVAEAIQGGYIYLYVNSPDSIAVTFHLPSRPHITVKLHKSILDPRDLFNLAWATPPPMAEVSVEASSLTPAELRALRAELSQKESEISHLNARLQSAKATVARATNTEKKPPNSPQKKKPANASALQPNQKRRKAVEDEFAGSDSDE